MTAILVAGISYRSAPVALREQLAFAPGEISAVLPGCLARTQVDEAMLLSTCNRVELYAVGERSGLVEAFDWLCQQRGVMPARLRGLVDVKADRDAVLHCFRVAASLDSMIVGEPQILGQVKDAFELARRAGTVGPLLHRLLSQAFAVAKRVRTETAVAKHAVSIPSGAVELAGKIFGRLEGRAALLIGAGDMGELAARHLVRQGISSLHVTNRTWARAVELSRLLSGTPVPFGRWPEELAHVDIVITSARSSQPLVTVDGIRGDLSRRRARPIFFIDIAVPRNVEPGVAQLENVFCYDVDDLQRVVASNLEERQREAARAEFLIMGEVDRFLTSLRDLDVVPAIVALRRQVEAMSRTDLERALRELPHASRETHEAFETLVAGIVNKILHPPTVKLREAAGAGGGREWAEAVSQLFALSPAAVPGRAARRTDRADGPNGSGPITVAAR
ncbi:MAG: glutamyl-tRNA reductase [Candidatus Rokubacteria bacterium]|nr:glutamyl-tRNA reductase [Candidatus Rokubacteria bacterium]